MDLQSGERVIYQRHPSWRSILGFYLFGFGVALVIGAIVKAIESTDAGILAVAAIAALTVLASLIKPVATTYTITDRRLNIKRGLVARKVQASPASS